MITIEQAMSNYHRAVSEAEIAAYLEGTADPLTARRILALSLRDPAFRKRLDTLRVLTAEDDQRTGAGDEESAAADNPRAARLAAFVNDQVLQMAAEELRASGEQASRERAAKELLPAARALLAALTGEKRGGGIRAAAEGLAAVRDALRSAGERVLSVRGATLTLPGLAPAFASPEAAPDFAVQRQALLTEDGARVEFHFLPGASERLRVYVDAGTIKNRAEAREAAPETAPLGYNVAYLTLEDRGVAASGGGAAHEWHVLAVPLNAEGRGLTEYTLSGEGIGTLSRPRSAYHLVDVRLAHLETGGVPD